MTVVRTAQNTKLAGTIGDDNDAILRLICPHLDQLEQSVADALLPLRRRLGDRKLKVLDLGCGDGRTSKAILRTIRGVELIALDNDPKMIGEFKENLGPLPAGSSVDCILEEARTFLENCEAASFDAVASCFVLHNCDEEYRRKAIKEIYRVLKAKGTFVNADKLAQAQPLHGKTILQQVTLVIDTYTAAGRPDLLREWVIHYLEDNIPGRLWLESDAVRDLQRVGFAKIENTFRYDLEATLVAVKAGLN